MVSGFLLQLVLFFGTGAMIHYWGISEWWMVIPICSFMFGMKYEERP